MSRLFGWDLPPGCSQSDIDRAAGVEGPMDCPVCVDGKELDGDECPKCGNVTCPTHGCVVCQDLEKQRVYCAGPFCGDYLRAGKPVLEHEGRKFCSERCVKDFKEPYDMDDAEKAGYEPEREESDGEETCE